MLHLKIIFSGGAVLGGGLMTGLHDLRGLFQQKIFCESM